MIEKASWTLCKARVAGHGQIKGSAAIIYVLTCTLPKRKPSPLCAWLLHAPIERNTKHAMVSHTHSAQRTCKRCGSGVDNEHHTLLECSHSALAVIRSEHRALFDGISDVRTLMAAAYKPELANLSWKLHARHTAWFGG